MSPITKQLRTEVWHSTKKKTGFQASYRRLTNNDQKSTSLKCRAVLGI